MKRKVKQYFQRTLALLLCVMMLFSVADFSVFATELPEGTDTTVTDDVENTDGTDQGEELDGTEGEETPDVTDPNAGIATADVEANAAEEPLAVVYAASDFQLKSYNSSNKANGDDIPGAKANMTAIVEQMQKAGYVNGTVDGALFCGDYSAYGNTWSTDNNITKLDWSANGLAAVAEVLNTEWGLTYDEVVYVQGNHDPSKEEGLTGLDKAGANDTDYYGVYVLHEDDFQWRQGGTSESGNDIDAKNAAIDIANDLDEYLEKKVEAKFDQPIFICSHVPLHYSSRTKSTSNADNIYAKYIFDVINEHAKKLDIIFLFGHDHSSTYDDYLGGSAIYLPAGEDIIVADVGSNSSYQTYALNFTYMNAGYLGYYSGECEASCTNGLSSTIFEIYEDKVVIGRYGSNGLGNLKDKGIDSTNTSWSGEGDAVNEEVYSDKQTITLKEHHADLVLGTLASGYMKVGATDDLAFSGLYDTKYNVEWTSSDENIATVKASDDTLTGTITALAEGTTTITATATEVADTRAVGDVTTLTYQLTVANSVPSGSVELVPAGDYPYFKKVDSVTLGKTYLLVDMEDDGYVVGQQQALHYNEDRDTNEEGDTQPESTKLYEVNADGVDVFQLPIDGETVTLSTEDNENCWWIIQQNPHYSGEQWVIRTYKNRTNRYLSVSEGNGDEYNNHDGDHDRLRMLPSSAGLSNGWSNYSWNYKTKYGLYTDELADDYNFALYYSQAQTDFSGRRFDSSAGYLSETINSKVYLFEQTTTTLSAPISAYVDDITGYVNKDVGYNGADKKRYGGAQAGGNIVITNDGTELKVPVTIDMLSGSFDVTTPGVYKNLTVQYAGVDICKEGYTLVVNDSTTLLKNDAAREYMDNLYVITDKMVPGKQYLIVDTNKEGIAHAAAPANEATVVAKNVLVQKFPVDGQELHFIDSTYYSDVADATQSGLTGRGIEEHGNINGYFAESDDDDSLYQEAIRLVWTPSQRYFPYVNGSTEFFQPLDKTYSFMTSQMKVAQREANQILSIAGNAENKQLKLTAGDAKDYWDEWIYDDSNGGLHLNIDNVSHAYLFYNFQNIISNAKGNAAAKNFQTETASVTSGGVEYKELQTWRRVWLYERVTDIDTISARISDKTSTVTAYVDGQSESTTGATFTGDYILVDTTHADGTVTTEQVPITISMLSGNYDLRTVDTYSDLTVTYQGVEVCKDYTLIVEKFVPNVNPEFPNEGAVKIDKKLDTTKYNYLETGAATIDLSVTGVPAQSGVDLVVILDASSSMYKCVHSVARGTKCDDCGVTISDSNIRMAVMENTLENMFASLKEPIDGYTPDVDVAVATFNGYTPINTDYELYYSGGPADSSDTYEGCQQANEDKPDAFEIRLPFTNIADIDANVLNQKADYETKINRGTNYDRAMELAYDLLKEKQEQNAANGVTREAVVVFMSDGAAYQFNYFQGDASMTYWNNYLTGDDSDGKLATAIGKQSAAVQSVFAKYNGSGKHWLAEAIKADTNTTDNKIIDPDAMTVDHIDYVRGLGATMYTVGFGLGDDDTVTSETCIEVLKNMATAEEYYFAANNNEQLDKAFAKIAGDIRRAGNAVFTDQMGGQFDLITSNEYEFIKEGQTTTTTITLNPIPNIEVKSYELYRKSEVGQTLTFGETQVKVTQEMVGTRKPIEPTIIETISFNEDGTKVYSTLDVDGDEKTGTADNILEDKVIHAATFWYNTDKANVQNITVNGESVPLGTETFYWNIGDIPEEELVLSYSVYLAGSMEGSAVAGTYDTNTHAELNYTTYLGTPNELKVPSPKLPWQQGTVGYAFYLVNADGDPIINQTTGETGSFEHAVKITQPIYKDFLLNSSGEDVIAEQIIAQNVLPDGYTLFDENAQYDVELDSNGDGYYKIIKGDVAPTTYVVGIKDTAYKETEKFGKIVTTENYLTANTIVWFGVVSTVACVPDTVVIDYGLPVNINVAANDTMMGNYGAVQFVGGKDAFATEYETAKANDASLEYWEYLKTVPVTTTAKFETETIPGTYGTSTILKNGEDYTGKIQYKLDESKSMTMHEKETFVYATNYTGSVGTKGYYYSTVTVIPATTIYYEDSFVDYKVYNKSDFALNTEVAKQWVDVDANGNVLTTLNTAIQEEDRPGNFSLSGLDANNVYGTDAAYENMAQLSMGSAKKLTVSKDAKVFGEAIFDFWGTGFDIVSLTSDDTGTITVDIYDKAEFETENYDATILETRVVDTYYGYAYKPHEVVYSYVDGEWVETDASVKDEMGTSEDQPENPAEDPEYKVYEMRWTPAANDPDELYQVPIIKVTGLPYTETGYTAVVTVDYLGAFDHKKDSTNSYEFYLDAIRIYDPANNGVSDSEIKDAYVADKEGWPSYVELRNKLIEAKTFDSLGEKDEIEGIIFIDGNSALTDDNAYLKNPVTNAANAITDYKNFGPNNELYLAPGQAVAFQLAAEKNVASVQLAYKTVGGETDVKIWDGNAKNIAEVSSETVSTATDLYHDITDLRGKTVVIFNVGEDSDAVLSVTNIKTTYNDEPENAEVPAMLTFRMSRSIAATAMTAMSVEEEAEPEVPTIPEDDNTTSGNTSGTTDNQTNSNTSGTTGSQTSGNTSGTTSGNTGTQQGTVGGNGTTGAEDTKTDNDALTDKVTENDKSNATTNDKENDSNQTTDNETSETSSFLGMLWDMIVGFFKSIFQMFMFIKA